MINEALKWIGLTTKRKVVKVKKEKEDKPITEKWDEDMGDNAWCLPDDLGDK